MYHFFNLFFMNMAYLIGNIVFLYKHFVTLENVIFPKLLLYIRKGIKDLQNQWFFHLNYLSHGICSCFWVINICHKALETKDKACKHRLFVYKAFVCKLNYTATFLHKKDVFCNLTVIYYSFIGVKSKLLP